MPFVAVLQSVAQYTGIAVAGLGTAVLIGWALDVATLKSLFPHLSTMKANTAFAMLLGGTSLLLLARSPVRARHAAQACAVTVAVIGAVTLAEYLTGYDLGIDELLARETPSAVPASSPGRMGINTAAAFVLLGLALLLVDREPPRERSPPSSWPSRAAPSASPGSSDTSTTSRRSTGSPRTRRWRCTPPWALSSWPAVSCSRVPIAA